jgi:membrane protein required for colicin V production
MNWFDLLILAVLAVSVVAAFVRGFLLELFSLVGLFLGLVIAAEEYAPLAQWLQGWTRLWKGRWAQGAAAGEAANLIAFLFIALLVMLVATFVGRLLRGTVRHVGLGFVDRILGAGLGFVKGCAVMTLAVMAISAFLPQAGYLNRSRLAPYFFEAAHQGARLTPVELGNKIREGVEVLRSATKQ